MGRGKMLSDFEKGKILGLRARQLGIRDIARKIGRSPNLVSNFLSNTEEYGTKKSPGRPTILSQRLKRKIINAASNNTIGTRKIASAQNPKISATTVWRVLDRSPTLVRSKFKKAPALRDQHKQKRLEFARGKASWTREWQQVKTQKTPFFDFFSIDHNFFRLYSPTRRNGIWTVVPMV